MSLEKQLLQKIFQQLFSIKTDFVDGRKTFKAIEGILTSHGKDGASRSM